MHTSEAPALVVHLGAASRVRVSQQATERAGRRNRDIDTPAHSLGDCEFLATNHEQAGMSRHEILVHQTMHFAILTRCSLRVHGLVGSADGLKP